MSMLKLKIENVVGIDEWFYRKKHYIVLNWVRYSTILLSGVVVKIFVHRPFWTFFLWSFIELFSAVNIHLNKMHIIINNIYPPSIQKSSNDYR